MLPCVCVHALPEVRSHDARTYRVDANGRQLDCQGTRQSFDCSADACDHCPSLVRAPACDSRCENDRAAIANLRTSIFDRGKYRPITQFKCASRLLEICLSKLVQLQAVTCSENQVIKAAKVREKAFHSLFVGDINRL